MNNYTTFIAEVNHSHKFIAIVYKTDDNRYFFKHGNELIEITKEQIFELDNLF